MAMVAYCHDGKEGQRDVERDDSERLRGFDDGQRDRQMDICNSS